MSELQDIIELLLTKRDNLLREKSNEIKMAISTINEKYALRANKIQALLDECGYVEQTQQTSVIDEPKIEQAGLQTNTISQTNIFPIRTAMVNTNLNQEATANDSRLDQ